MYGVLRSDGRSERAIFVIDKKGIIRYVDVHNIDLQPDNEVLFRVLAELEPEAALAYDKAQQQAAATSQPAPAPTADVIIYCTPWCPDCRRAKAYLNEKGISVAEVDISRDRAAAAQVRAWANGNETTPTFNIKGTIIVDYNKAKLDQVLGLA